MCLTDCERFVRRRDVVLQSAAAQWRCRGDCECDCRHVDSLNFFLSMMTLLWLPTRRPHTVPIHLFLHGLHTGVMLASYWLHTSLVPTVMFWPPHCLLARLLSYLPGDVCINLLHLGCPTFSRRCHPQRRHRVPQRRHSVCDRPSPHCVVLCAVYCTAADCSRLGGSVGVFVAAVNGTCDCVGDRRSVAVLLRNAVACVVVRILTADCVPY
jgi:hypothetical protein